MSLVKGLMKIFGTPSCSALETSKSHTSEEIDRASGVVHFVLLIYYINHPATIRSVRTSPRSFAPCQHDCLPSRETRRVRKPKPPKTKQHLRIEKEIMCVLLQLYPVKGFIALNSFPNKTYTAQSPVVHSRALPSGSRTRARSVALESPFTKGVGSENEPLMNLSSRNGYEETGLFRLSSRRTRCHPSDGSSGGTRGNFATPGSGGLRGKQEGIFYGGLLLRPLN